MITMNYPFLKLCYLLLSITFWLLVVASIFGLSTDLFLDGPQVKLSNSSYFGGYAHHKTGYPIIVKPNIPTHTQTYTANDTIASITTRQLKLSSDLKEEIIDNKELVLEQARFFAKPKHGSIHILAGIKYYISVIFSILVFWFSRKLIKSLMVESQFKIKTIHYLNALGAVLISSFLLSVIFDLFIGIQIDIFKLQTIKDGIEVPLSKITFNPSIDFEWIYLVLGLLSLGVRKLFTHGNSLQKENDLTI